MKKGTKIIIAIIAIALGTVGVLYILNTITGKKLNEQYSFISEIKETKNYTVKRIINKELTYHFDREFETEARENKEDDIDSYIYYTAVTNNFWIETNEYVHPRPIEERTQPYLFEEWLNVDMNGNILSVKADSNIKTKPGMLLKNEVTLYYDWKDKSSRFYVDHFYRQKFNWNSLNPLRGWGAPNGIPPNRYWEGTTFMKLLMDKETLEFKINTMTMESGYTFDLNLYRIPKSATNKETVFLYIGNKYLSDSDKGLYIIREK